ncbi:hypothetical protein PV326_007932 [Microctonus aethiopoides]|nr:hypothetical protein PV326_007932 [Microctonus aethiopoides]
MPKGLKQIGLSYSVPLITNDNHHYKVGRLWHVIVAAAALRGVAIQRGRVGPAARAAFPASAAALALARNPGPLAAAAAATALHPFAPAVYYDPFLAAHAATQDPNYRLQVRINVHNT